MKECSEIIIIRILPSADSLFTIYNAIMANNIGITIRFNSFLFFFESKSVTMNKYVIMADLLQVAGRMMIDNTKVIMQMIYMDLRSMYLVDSVFEYCTETFENILLHKYPLAIDSTIAMYAEYGPGLKKLPVTRYI